MGRRKFRDYIPDACHRRYSCVHCRAHLANHDELISKVSITCWQCTTYETHTRYYIPVVYTEYIHCLYSLTLTYAVISRQPRQSLPVQPSVSFCYFYEIVAVLQKPSLLFWHVVQCQYWMWKGRGKNSIDWSTLCSRYTMQKLQNHSWLEICEPTTAHHCTHVHQRSSVLVLVLIVKADMLYVQVRMWVYSGSSSMNWMAGCQVWMMNSLPWPSIQFIQNSWVPVNTTKCFLCQLKYQKCKLSVHRYTSHSPQNNMFNVLYMQAHRQQEQV